MRRRSLSVGGKEYRFTGSRLATFCYVKYFPGQWGNTWYTSKVFELEDGSYVVYDTGWSPVVQMYDNDEVSKLRERHPYLAQKAGLAKVIDLDK